MLKSRQVVFTTFACEKHLRDRLQSRNQYVPQISLFSHLTIEVILETLSTSRLGFGVPPRE